MLSVCVRVAVIVKATVLSNPKEQILWEHVTLDLAAAKNPTHDFRPLDFIPHFSFIFIYF